METITTIKEFDKTIYNVRYKYGYNWQCYHQLSMKFVELLKATGVKDKKIIDIGCGIGWFTDMVYFNVSKNIKGIDFSEKAICMHANRLYPAIDFELADIYNFDYNKYEVAILMEVLEHLDKDIELMSMLPVGCQVYATVPYEKERQDITHVREYSLEGLKQRYGEIIDIKSCEKVDQYILFWGVRK